ncbi:MAG: 2,3-bisphosphoglycerate-independent phosphoglycerate mutase, partial [Dongiaceae bacterium]
MKKPLLLCILDGWGYRVEKEDNAIALANTPNWNRLIEQYPHSFLTTCGFDVGLPEGQMGNSEVGHMNLGAGRVVMQDLPRIDLAIKDGSLRQNPKLQDFIAKLKASKGRAHVMGLFSPGGVHAHQDHIITLAHYISEAGVPVLLHLFTDGRDTPPQSAITYINHLLREMANFKNTAIATIGGRYFAMDRDKRWERVQLAYETLVEGKGLRAKDGISAIEDSYARIEHDEFIKPAVIGGYEGMVDGDGILCANFRADRVRQILAALLDPDFIPFPRKNV